MLDHLVDDAYKLLRSGFNKAPDDLVQKRLEVCNLCASFNCGSTSCKECGCYMNIKTKYTAMVCPLRKW